MASPMKETKVEAISVSYGTFATVKQLKDELNRVVSVNHDKDIPLEPPINATVAQQGSRFVAVTLETAIVKN